VAGTTKPVIYHRRHLQLIQHQCQSLIQNTGCRSSGRSLTNLVCCWRRHSQRCHTL